MERHSEWESSAQARNADGRNSHTFRRFNRLPALELVAVASGTQAKEDAAFRAFGARNGL